MNSLPHNSSWHQVHTIHNVIFAYTSNSASGLTMLSQTYAKSHPTRAAHHWRRFSNQKSLHGCRTAVTVVTELSEVHSVCHILGQTATCRPPGRTPNDPKSHPRQPQHTSQPRCRAHARELPLAVRMAEARLRFTDMWVPA